MTEDDGITKDQAEAKFDELNKEEDAEENSQFAQLEEELVNVREERDKYEKRLKRLQADFSNYKKRQIKQKDKLVTRTKKDLINELLPIIDNFERALASANDGNSEDIVEGINMVYKQLNKFLDKSGVKQIGKAGEEFNPNCHDAVVREECEEYSAEQISEVLQKGYQIEDEIIRPAVVKVVE